MPPLGIAAFLRTLAIESSQIGAGGCLDARGLRETRQKLLVRLARIPSHDAPQRRVRLQRGRIDPDRLPLDEIRRRQDLQDPREDRAVCLQIDEAPRPRDRRVFRRDFVQAQAQKPTKGERVGGAPRDPALRVDTLEVPNQQQPEVRAWCQTRAAEHRRIERSALRFDEFIEGVRVQDSIQALVERVPAGRRQLISRNPQSRCAGSVLTTTHGHAVSVVRRIDRVDPLLTTGC